MNEYRNFTCGQLRAADAGKRVRLAGWVHRKRNLGNLCFVDLRDHYGITQCVFDSASPLFEKMQGIRVESVIGIDGEAVIRENINKNIPTGEIEIKVDGLKVYSEAEVLPFQVAIEDDAPEEIRLKYRFLDLRKERIHKNILLRSAVIERSRQLMREQGFTEYQTPILTASSPEGARDFLVPSRLNPGKFYALPQAPQQFKQLLMVSGFDKYFQIAPCFRDEDPRADRSPGEFYQMDMEMSFATQDDVFAVIEHTLGTIFNEFANGKKVDQAPFVRIPFREAMMKYGSDKPDLRNPLVLQNATDFFGNSGFGVYDNLAKEGKTVKAMTVAGIADKPRSFFDKLDAFAKEEGMGGIAYVALAAAGAKGIARFFNEEKMNELKDKFGLKEGDAVLFMAGASNLTSSAGGCATRLRKSSDWLTKMHLKCAGSLIFRFMRKTRKQARSSFRTIRFRCRRGEWTRCLTKIRSTFSLISMTLSATGLNCCPVRCATMSRKLCTRRLKLPVMTTAWSTTSSAA